MEHSGAKLGNLLEERIRRKKRLSELQTMVTDVVSEKFRSPAFWVASILMTCIFLMLFIAIWIMLMQKQSESDPLNVLFTWAPVAACALASAIVSWRLILAKNTVTADKMRGLGAFLVCMVVMSIILGIVMGIIAMFFYNYLSYYQSDFEIPDDMMILLENVLGRMGISMNDLLHDRQLDDFLVIVTCGAAFVVVFCFLYVVMCIKTMGHINFLRNAVAAKHYDIRHSAPSVWIFVIAGLTLIGGIDLIASVRDWLTGLLGILAGIYLILLAVFFLGIEREERFIYSRFDREINEINELEERIVAEYRRQTEQDVRESQRNQEAWKSLRVQQQQIMDALMQRTNAAAPPDESSPEEVKE